MLLKLRAPSLLLSFQWLHCIGLHFLALLLLPFRSVLTLSACQTTRAAICICSAHAVCVHVCVRVRVCARACDVAPVVTSAVKSALSSAAASASGSSSVRFLLISFGAISSFCCCFFFFFFLAFLLCFAPSLLDIDSGYGPGNRIGGGSAVCASPTAQAGRSNTATKKPCVRSSPAAREISLSERQEDRETGGLRDRGTEGRRNRQGTQRYRDRGADGPSNRATERRTDRQTER